MSNSRGDDYLGMRIIDSINPIDKKLEDIILAVKTELIKEGLVKAQ